MRLIGCDLHASQQSIAMLDCDTGVPNKTSSMSAPFVAAVYARAVELIRSAARIIAIGYRFAPCDLESFDKLLTAAMEANVAFRSSRRMLPKSRVTFTLSAPTFAFAQQQRPLRNGHAPASRADSICCGVVVAFGVFRSLRMGNHTFAERAEII